MVKLTYSPIRFRNGVQVPKSCIIAAAAGNAANDLGLKTITEVTSGNDSAHMRGSKHYSDEALDFRTKHLSTDEKHAWKARIQKRLGRAYQVILEDEGESNEHLHVEHDPD